MEIKNSDKTQVKIFSKRTKISTHRCKIKIGEQEIAWINQVKYFRIILERWLSFNAYAIKKYPISK